MIFVFDIDGTILEATFRDGEYILIAPYERMINIINKLHFNGHTIIIQTGRHWNHLKDTIEHLKQLGVKYHTLTMGKPYADYYIDDKGILPEDFINKLPEILNAK